jgi:protein-disulfide isomerase
MTFIHTMTTEAKILTGIVVVTIAIVIGAVFFLSQPEKPVIINAETLIRDDSLKISTDSAKLTIVEFGDFQCPACKMAHPGMKQALADFPGQVNFVFRHYPLPMHINAQAGAKAVEAANRQGKVWEMYDKIFDSQDEWANESNPTELFKRYATELGMDGEKLAADMNDSVIQDKINKDLADGNLSGVNSTPTFFFNNELYRGGIGYADFKAEIEKRLAQ